MDKPVDVLVIGAGVIGLACAFRVASAGRRVLLLDRDQPGLGASFGNAGHIATEQVVPLASPDVLRGALAYLLDRESPLRIRPAYLLSILPWLVQFVKASRHRAFDRGVMALSALQKTAQTDIESLLHDACASHLLKMNGHMVIVENPKSMPTVRKEIARSRALGIDANWITPSQVKVIAPDLTANIEGAIKFANTGHVADPYAVCTALCDAFLAAGGKFLQADVVKIENNADGFSASTSAGIIHHAKYLVLCCGAWSKTLAAQLGYPVPLDTERGYHITLRGISPQFTIPVASFERKVIMTPMSTGLRMTGIVEFGGLQLPPDPTRFALLTRHMNAMAANLPTNTMTMWMGFRPSLPDHLPVLGRVPNGSNLFFAFGHQHLGLTLAGVTARIIAGQILGQESEIDLAPFSPDRF